MAITLDGHEGKSLVLKVGLRATSGGTVTNFWPAATIGTSTLAADTPASTWIAGVLEPSLNFGRSLFSGCDPRNLSDPGTGVINLFDSGTELDYLLDYSWDGVTVELYRGSKTALLSTWGAAVGKFTGKDIIGDFDRKQIRLRDTSWKLNCILHSEYYTGAGGVNGDAAVTGHWKPYLIGECFNFEPKLFDSANLIYQIHIRKCDSVSDVRHGGVSLVFDANYANYADLVAATPAVGEYATCLDDGFIKINVDLERSIRVDAIGEDVTINGHTTPSNRSDIVRRIVTYDGATTLDDTNDLDSTSFAAVETDHPAPLGFYWNSEITKANAIKEVMSGILGWAYIKVNGKLAIGYLRIPSSVASAETIAFKSYGMSKIELIDFQVPWTEIHIGWQKNYGPESRDRLAPGISSEDFGNLLGQESSWVVQGDPAILTTYPSAPTVWIQGNFVNETDANDEANRQNFVMGVVRRRYRCTLEIDQFADILEQYITITDVNKLKLGSSTKMLCVAVDGVGFGPLTVEWWI